MTRKISFSKSIATERDQPLQGEKVFTNMMIRSESFMKFTEYVYLSIRINTIILGVMNMYITVVECIGRLQTYSQNNTG